MALVRRDAVVHLVGAEAGLEAERIKMVNVSAAMAKPFVDHVNELMETVKTLGPNPISKNRAIIKEEIEV